MTMAKPSKIKAGKTENLTNAGKGRPKGAVNKTTALLKDAILKAAEAAGDKIALDDEGKPTGVPGMIAYLTQQAEDNPGPFMSLLGKVLPMQVAGTGDDGEPTSITIHYVSPGS